MELMKIWDTMIRRRRSIATIFFGFFIAVYLFTQWVPPTYESSAIILVRESNGANAILAALGFSSSTPGTEDFDADTEIAMGLIEPILDAAIKQMNLVDRSGKAMTVRKLVKGGLLNNFSPQPLVEVEQIEESSMLEIIGSSGDSNQASELSNLLANLYISKRIELNQKDFETALTFVGGHISAVRQDFYNDLHTYRDFMAKTGAIL